MTRPTDAAIARAFWEEWAEDQRLWMARPAMCNPMLAEIMEKACNFDAEAGGTDRQTKEVIACDPVVQPERQGVAGAADGKAAAPYTPPDGKVACPIPTCRAELFPGQACGGVNCGLRGK